MALRYSDGQGNPIDVLEEIAVDKTAFLPIGDLNYSKLSYCDAMGEGSGSVSLSGRFIIDIHDDDAEQLAQQLLLLGVIMLHDGTVTGLFSALTTGH